MYKFFFIILLLLLTTGCSVKQEYANTLANQLQQKSPESILSILKETEPDESDFAQYNLNIGYLQLISGEFELAIGSFRRAKTEMASLEAISVIENFAAGTLNETFRRYSGYPTDRVMLHNMLALSYLLNQDISGARVEMLQADIAMKKLSQSESLNGQLASTHLLSGIVYELLDEQSNAFISYQFAEKILIQRKIAIPNGLKKSLLRMSYKMGNDQQYHDYGQLYPGNDIGNINGNKQVFLLYFDGVVSNKIERSIFVPNHNGEQLIRISIPGYPVINKHSQHTITSDGKQKTISQLVENIEVLVREDLAKEYPSILLLTTTRAIAKYKLIQKANDKNALLGTLLNIAAVLSEVADVRSWSMLPRTIQFSYLETASDNIMISTVKHPNTVINLTGSQQHLILATSLSDKIFHYQQ